MMIVSLTEFPGSLELWEIIFLGLFLFMFLVRLVSDLVFYGKVAFYRSKPRGIPDQLSTLSLIITLRNEEENVKENLPKVLSYMTGRGEVIVIDDFSQDQTYTLLGLIREQFPNLKFSSLNQEIRHSVKVSQNIGLKAATGEWVIFLPPVIGNIPENWLLLLQNSYLNDKNAIIGYLNIKPSRGFFNHLWRLESFFQQLKSFSFLLNGLGFVVNEENIAFRKSAYFSQGGYGKKINEVYANLELIINNFIRKKTTVLNFENDSAIRLPVSKSRNDYIDLLNKYKRIRSHLPFYKRAAFVADACIRFLWLVLSVAAIIWFFDIWIFVATLFALKLVIRGIVIKLCLNRLKEKKLFLSSVIYDALMPYRLIFAGGSMYRRVIKRRWKK